MIFLNCYFCPSTSNNNNSNNNKKWVGKKKARQIGDKIILPSWPSPYLFFKNHSYRSRIVYTVVISFLLTHVCIWKEKINFMISGKSLRDLEKANKRKLRTQATKQSSAVAHWILCLGNVNEPQILPIIRWGNCLYFQTDDAAIMKRLTGNLRVSTVVIWFLL